jgi:hypothetical protein
MLTYALNIRELNDSEDTGMGRINYGYLFLQSAHTLPVERYHVTCQWIWISCKCILQAVILQ